MELKPTKVSNNQYPIFRQKKYTKQRKSGKLKELMKKTSEEMSTVHHADLLICLVKQSKYRI